MVISIRTVIKILCLCLSAACSAVTDERSRYTQNWDAFVQLPAVHNYEKFQITEK